MRALTMDLSEVVKPGPMKLADARGLTSTLGIGVMAYNCFEMGLWRWAGSTLFANGTRDQFAVVDHGS